MSFNVKLTATADRVDAFLDGILHVPSAASSELMKAMRYGVLGSGKRLRPFLLIETAALFGMETDQPLHAAAALECIHCYSLIHDDLPAMDDDDLRRGRPTVHIAFGEAAAILAGDALLTLAFEIMSDPATHQDPGIRCEVTSAMARAAGGGGMVGGQMLDIGAQQHKLGLDETLAMQSLKTGALIEFACWAGGCISGAGEEDLEAVRIYARHIGMAFQIVDDLLDTRGDSGQLGKRTGKDAVAGKATFIDHFGVDAAEQKVDDLVTAAISALDRFGEGADSLRDAARFTANRRH